MTNPTVNTEDDMAKQTTTPKIMKLNNGCPNCSGVRATRINREHLQCTLCGFIGPQQTFDSILEFIKWRTGFEYGIGNVPDKKEAMVHLRSIYDEHLKNLEG